MQQTDVNGGSITSVLTVSTESPTGPAGDTSDVSVTLPPVSSINIGKAPLLIMTPRVRVLGRRILTNGCWARTLRHIGGHREFLFYLITGVFFFGYDVYLSVL